MKQLNVLVMIILGLFATSEGGRAQDRNITVESVTGQKFAFLVGVGEYEHFSDLRYTVKDIEAFRDQLEASGFPKQNITVISSGAKIAFRPTKKNIERAFQDIVKQLRKDDVIVCMFSGHGTEIDGEPLFCPEEAALGTATELRESCVSLKKIMTDLENSSAKFKWVIVDACRNNPTKSGGVKALGDIKMIPAGIAVFQSCASGQVSRESEQFGHGVFTHFLLEGLKGDAADKSGEITLFDLCKYTIKKTTELDPNQCPYVTGEMTDFVLSTVSKKVEEYENSIGIKLIKIPAGKFLMGSLETPEKLVSAFARYYKNSDKPIKEEWFADEHPPKESLVKKSFFLGKTEVTVGQFEEFVNATNYRTTSQQDVSGGVGIDAAGKLSVSTTFSWKNPGFKQTSTHPVVNVSWCDADEFCKWLSKQEGKTYRLPTEVEWEYACRAGTSTRYWFGDNPEDLAKYDNVADRTAREKFSDWFGCISERDGHIFTSTVDAFPANLFGIIGMHGNVCEWCHDTYSSGGNDSDRIFRGGSWYNWSNIARSSNRHHVPPNFRNCYLGFRVVLDTE